jgi:hypothetical protein
MYVVHYVASRHNDQAVDEGVSAADTLPGAIVRVKARLKYTTIALPPDPSTPRPIGFLIFDATGHTLLHRDICRVKPQLRDSAAPAGERLERCLMLAAVR